MKRAIMAILATSALAGCTAEDRLRLALGAGPLAVDIFCAGDRAEMTEAAALYCAARELRPRPRPEGLGQ